MKTNKEDNAETSKASKGGDRPRINFKEEDVARVAEKNQKDYPKTHAPPPSVSAVKHTKNEDNHVSFKCEDAETIENKKHKHYPKTHAPRIENPAKIKVSKEDFLTHLSIVGVFIIIFCASVIFSKKTFDAKPSILSDIQKNIEDSFISSLVDPKLPGNTLINVGSKGGSSDSNCALYLAESSVPNSGFGIYAMKSFSEGDIIIPSCKKNIVIDGIDFSPYILSMKEHPLYHNVKGGYGGSPIIASKPIEGGSELFFQFEQNNSHLEKVYRELHPDDPTSETFAKVDKIVESFIENVPMQKVKIKSKRKQYKQKAKVQYTEKPAMDVTPFLKLIKDTLLEYDTEISRILPDTHMEAFSMVKAGGSHAYISNKPHTTWLSQNGVCVDGVHPSKSGIYGGKDGAFATRKVFKGDVVISSPLLATARDEIKNDCFNVIGTVLMLCPLSFASYINNGLSQCSSENLKECASNVANSYYQWSLFNELNKNLGHITTMDLLKQKITGMTIDVIANRDIEEGEEVLIDYSYNVDESSDSLRQLKNDMILWKV
mmetsp:Transcript_26282/g.30020  ORF Transcript_26282/g.30020 Transcript_26282/m.30020 type:complete len:545 (-) Transcript_26282:2028-3662(-)